MFPWVTARGNKVALAWYGANVGGPIYIPHLYNGHGKSFFFFNWESGYAAQGATPQYYIVPTQAQRNGNFQGLTDSSRLRPS